MQRDRAFFIIGGSSHGVRCFSKWSSNGIGRQERSRLWPISTFYRPTTRAKFAVHGLLRGTRSHTYVTSVFSPLVFHSYVLPSFRLRFLEFGKFPSSNETKEFVINMLHFICNVIIFRQTDYPSIDSSFIHAD